VVTTLRTAPRILTSLSALALSIGALTGCTPEPEPTPTPTAAFASEEEAFTAAEEVYREYVAASNDVDIAEPATFEPLFDLSSGDFEAADRKSLSELHAEGYTITGTVTMMRFTGVEAAYPYELVVADICVDVSASDVLDESGTSVVPPTRPDVNPLRVSFRYSDKALLIDHADRNEDATCSTD
jgi:hypothetical protein